ncbi:hypothetical protein MKX03_030189 [Papaver bracteatum]|nr:hypothetical protein MKX03_030189 [Papaver bracteatum]
MEEESNTVADHGMEGEVRTKYKGKHDKPKPWDHDGIDHWKIDKFDPTWNEGGMLEVSSFSTLFPVYREKYLQDAWPSVKGALKQFDISCDLNLTRDPYIIVKARDLIKLLSRSVPAPQAIKILDDEMQCDIIKIGGLVRNKVGKLLRQHLLGPNSSTLKAIEILTGCYVLIQGLKQVRRIVEDCIQNKLHPIYHIRTLMMRRELEKVPELKRESWDRFLPKFKKKNVKQKKAKSKERKLYTPYPPPQEPSKIDLQLESGEYFLSENKKSQKKWQDKLEKQAEKSAESKKKREEAFIPPKETTKQESAKDQDKDDLAATTMNLKRKSKELKKQKARENIDPESYIMAPEKLSSKKSRTS